MKEAEKAQGKGKKSGDTTLNPLYTYARHCVSHFTWVITTVPTTNGKDTIRIPI